MAGRDSTTDTMAAPEIIYGSSQPTVLTIGLAPPAPAHLSTCAPRAQALGAGVDQLITYCLRNSSSRLECITRRMAGCAGYDHPYHRCRRLASDHGASTGGCILSMWHLRHLWCGNRETPSQRFDDVVNIYPSLGGD